MGIVLLLRLILQSSLILRQQPKKHLNPWNLPDKDPSANPIRVVNINFQSILHKKAELLDLVSTHKPHIIIGTETWLSNDTCNNEIIPEDWNYIIYRNDRSDGYGGVMIAISKQFTSSKISLLQTNCENIMDTNHYEQGYKFICWGVL